MGRIRRHWSKMRIQIRGDSGLCRESIMAWCEEHDVGYLLGLARSRCQVRAQGAELREARSVDCRTGRPARLFQDFTYRTRQSSSRSRRVVGKVFVWKRLILLSVRLAWMLSRCPSPHAPWRETRRYNPCSSVGFTGPLIPCPLSCDRPANFGFATSIRITSPRNHPMAARKQVFPCGILLLSA